MSVRLQVALDRAESLGRTQVRLLARIAELEAELKECQKDAKEPTKSEERRIRIQKREEDE